MNVSMYSTSLIVSVISAKCYLLVVNSFKREGNCCCCQRRYKYRPLTKIYFYTRRARGGRKTVVDF